MERENQENVQLKLEAIYKLNLSNYMLRIGLYGSSSDLEQIV